MVIVFHFLLVQVILNDPSDHVLTATNLLQDHEPPTTNRAPRPAENDMQDSTRHVDGRGSHTHARGGPRVPAKRQKMGEQYGIYVEQAKRFVMEASLIVGIRIFWHSPLPEDPRHLPRPQPPSPSQPFHKHFSQLRDLIVQVLFRGAPSGAEINRDHFRDTANFNIFAQRGKFDPDPEALRTQSWSGGSLPILGVVASFLQNDGISTLYLS